MEIEERDRSLVAVLTTHRDAYLIDDWTPSISHLIGDSLHFTLSLALSDKRENITNGEIILKEK